MGKGGSPPWYQTAVPEVILTWRLVSLSHWQLFGRCQTVRGLARTCCSEGRRVPTKRGRPLTPFLRGGAGRNRRASRRRRVIQMTGRGRLTSRASRSRAAKAPSATTTRVRVGNQRWACSTNWRDQSVSSLGRCWRSFQYFSEGVSAVRKGKAHTRPAQGIGASHIQLSQRNPLAFTQCESEERTGSR